VRSAFAESVGIATDIVLCWLVLAFSPDDDCLASSGGGTAVFVAATSLSLPAPATASLKFEEDDAVVVDAADAESSLVDVAASLRAALRFFAACGAPSFS
jgi:hypothetical protein